MLEHSVLATFVLPIAQALRHAGVDAMELIEESGIDPASVINPDRRIPVGSVQQLMARCVEETGDEAFGLLAAEQLQPQVLHGLGLAWFVFNDGELAQIAQAQEMPYQRTTCTTVNAIDYASLATATGCEHVLIENDDGIAAGIDKVIELMAANRPVMVDVRIDYSKKTQFTVGTVKTNIKRFDTRNKLRIISRALWRKVKNRRSK